MINDVIEVGILINIFFSGKTIFTPTLHSNGNKIHVSYTHSINEIIAVINRSESCRQHIEVECDGSFTGTRTLLWEDRSQNWMYNWGTPTGFTGCQCGLLGKRMIIGHILRKCSSSWFLVE